MAEITASGAKRAQQSALGRGFKALGRVLNPVLLPIVGSGVVPIWGVVRHRGRRSGRVFQTPVAVIGIPGGLLIPLPFGERTDWCRNLLAAGRGVMRWKRGQWDIDALEVIDTRVALPMLPGALRALVPAFGIKHFLKVRRTRSAA